MPPHEVMMIETYLAYFTEVKIQEFMNTFILKVLPLNYNIKEMLENKSENLCLTNENYYGQITGELDNPIHNITLKVISKFITKFPEKCIKLIHILVQQLLQSNLCLDNSDPWVDKLAGKLTMDQ